MTDSTHISVKPVVTGGRRVVVSPGGRPDLRLVSAHACRPVAPVRVASASSCQVARPVEKPVSLWLRVKVVVVGALILTAWGVPLVSFATSAMHPDPAVEYVAGDPAWAHVAQP